MKVNEISKLVSRFIFRRKISRIEDYTPKLKKKGEYLTLTRVYASTYEIHLLANLLKKNPLKEYPENFRNKIVNPIMNMIRNLATGKAPIEPFDLYFTFNLLNLFELIEALPEEARKEALKLIDENLETIEHYYTKSIWFVASVGMLSDFTKLINSFLEKARKYNKKLAETIKREAAIRRLCSNI